MKTYEITESAILHLHKVLDDGNAPYFCRRDLVTMFPEVFELKLVKGDWYKITDTKGSHSESDYALVRYSHEDREIGFHYGRKQFTSEFCGIDRLLERGTDKVEKASKYEVLIAFKDIAIKKGFIKGNVFMNGQKGFAFILNQDPDFSHFFSSSKIYLHDKAIYHNGIWASAFSPAREP